VLERAGTDWIVVVDDDGRLLGWVAEGDLLAGNETHQIADATVRPFAVTLRRTASLREALDTLVSSPTRIAVVVDDDDRYLGMLDVGRIGGEIDA
jgi:Mg/Co/Ni transporter MgtE